MAGESMSAFIWGMTLFVVAFAIQTVIWRIRLPKLHRKALLLLFTGTLVCGMLLIKVLSSVPGGFWKFLPMSFLEYVHLGIFFVSMELAYIVTYSGVEVDSPTAVMILRIADAGKKGLPIEAIDRDMGDDVLVMPRIRDLLADGKIRFSGGTYTLTPKGMAMIRLFVWYRSLMRLGKGG
jgi:hypothetical protein